MRSYELGENFIEYTKDQNAYDLGVKLNKHYLYCKVKAYKAT